MSIKKIGQDFVESTNTDSSLIIGTSSSNKGTDIIGTDSVVLTVVSPSDTYDNRWAAVAWSPELGMFAAIAIQCAPLNAVMTSYDGLEWTIRTSPYIGNDGNPATITWSPYLNLFLMTGGKYDDTVMTSSDGIDWTEHTYNKVGISVDTICWSPELSKFVVLGDKYAADSFDGLEWNDNGAIAPNGTRFTSIAWAPALNLFAAVTYSGNVYTSYNGIIWTIRTTAAYNNWESIVWAPELTLFVAVSSSGIGNQVMTSYNGVIWNIQTTPADNYWTSIAWAPGPGLFAAVASTGDQIMVSTNGVLWTLQLSAPGNWRSIAWSPTLDMFVAVGDGGINNAIAFSPVKNFIKRANMNIKAKDATFYGNFKVGTNTITTTTYGTVGIGSTLPSQKLDVAGNIKAVGATFTGTVSMPDTSLVLFNNIPLSTILSTITGNETAVSLNSCSRSGNTYTVTTDNSTGLMGVQVTLISSGPTIYDNPQFLNSNILPTNYATSQYVVSSSSISTNVTQAYIAFSENVVSTSDRTSTFNMYNTASTTLQQSWDGGGYFTIHIARPLWIQLKYPVKQTIYSYRMRVAGVPGNTTNIINVPVEWELQGSDDDTTFITVQTDNACANPGTASTTNPFTWVHNEFKDFTVQNPATYLIWRIRILRGFGLPGATSGQGQIIIKDIVFRTADETPLTYLTNVGATSASQFKFSVVDVFHGLAEPTSVICNVQLTKNRSIVNSGLYLFDSVTGTVTPQSI